MEDNLDVSSIDRKITSLENSLNYFTRQLNRIESSINLSKLKNETSGVEYAKFGATLSFLLCSLRHVQLKMEGKNVSTHPISNYLNRIKNYMKEINELQNKEKEKRPRVNKSVAHRIIKHST